jgi:hypothetical protein
MPDGTPSPTPEAQWLRDNWNLSALGQYKLKWIAVIGQQVIDNSPELDQLLERTFEKNPLYAYVYFGPLQ